jgi:hypothetical protein
MLGQFQLGARVLCQLPMGRLLDSQLIARKLNTLLQGEKCLPAAFEVSGQLFLLPVERLLLVKQFLLLLGQGRLLSHYRRRLNAQRGPFPLQGLAVGKQGVGFPIGARAGNWGRLWGFDSAGIH